MRSAPQRRSILGLAADDTYLQSLIPFQSTPETAHFGFRDFVAAPGKKARTRGMEESLPVSLTEIELDRLQQQGNDAFRAKDYPRAIRFYTDAIAKAGELNAPSPKKLQASRAAQLYANRCQAHLSSGDDAAALADANSAIKSAPGWPKAYYRHGTCLMRQKLYMQAHQVFQRGKQLDANNEELIKACKQAEEAIAKQGDSSGDATQTMPSANADDGKLSGSDADAPSPAAVKPGGNASAQTQPPPTTPAPPAVEEEDSSKHGHASGATSLTGIPATSGSAATSGASATPTGTASAVKGPSTESTPTADLTDPSATAVSSTAASTGSLAAGAHAAGTGTGSGGHAADAARTEDASPTAKQAPPGSSSSPAAAAKSNAPPGVGSSAGSKPDAPSLPIPEHTLSPNPEGGGYLLVVRLPKVARSSEVDLSIGPRIVEIEVPGMYAGLRVPLPKHPAVDDDEATARFDSKQRTLKLFLPTKS